MTIKTSNPRPDQETGHECQQRIRPRRSIAETLAMPGSEAIAFDPPRVEIQSRQVDFS